MKDKNALFLMQAIGELSEETVAEAKRPAAIRLRNLAAAVAAVVVAVFITAALITASAPDEPEQMVHVEQGGSAYLDKPATPDQIGETATQPPTEAPTEEPTEATEYEDYDDTDSTDRYDDGYAETAEEIPGFDMDALAEDAWERDQEYIQKWKAEHPGFKSGNLLDGVTGKNQNTSPTLPIIVWDPNY